MKLRTITFMLLAIFALTALFGFSAGAQGKVDYVTDNGNILLSEEEESLESLLADVSAKHNVDILVLTLENLPVGSNIDVVSLTFYNQGYNNGDYREDAIVFAVSMGSSDWSIRGYGEAYDIFTDKLCDAFEERIVPMLSDGDYADAFESCAEFFDEYYATGEIPKLPFEFKIWIPVALIIGLIVGFSVTSSMKKKLTSVEYKRDARGYSVPGSRLLENSSDTFLYSTVSKVAKPKNNSSSRGSSGGRSSGGRSGKF